MPRPDLTANLPAAPTHPRPVRHPSRRDDPDADADQDLTDHPLGRPPPASQVRPALVTLGLVLATIAVLNVLTTLAQPWLFRVLLYKGQYTAEKVGLYYDRPRSDILFMGSSRVFTGLDPSVAETRVWRTDRRRVRALNLAMVSAAIDENYLVLKNVISDDQKPEVIVYGLSEYELTAHRSYLANFQALTSRMPYSEHLLRIDDVSAYAGDRIEDNLDLLARQAFLIHRDQGLIRDALSIALNPADPMYSLYRRRVLSGEVQPDGFHATPSDWRPPDSAIEMVRRRYGRALNPYELDQGRMALLDAFLSLARARGIRVVLVNMPVTASLRALWGGEDRVEAYLATVRTIAERHDVPLVELYRDGERQIPPEGFYDWHHLNKDGAATLTRLVVDTVLRGG